MSTWLLVSLFAFIVFAPCVVALLSARRSSGTGGMIDAGAWMLPRLGKTRHVPLRAMLPEAEIADQFVIRSFPKGLSQYRLVVRDSSTGLRLHIAHVRAAAAELIRQNGSLASRQLALAAATVAAAGQYTSASITVAAREALEAARNAALWFAWGDAMTGESTLAAPPGGIHALQRPTFAQAA